MVDFTFSPYGEDPDDILRGLAEHIVQLKAQNETLRKALEDILAIRLQAWGTDYQEIHEACDIANKALKDTK